MAERIEKLMRDFLWEGVGEGKKAHLINWEVVSQVRKKKFESGRSWIFVGRVSCGHLYGHRFPQNSDIIRPILFFIIGMLL